MARSLPKLEVVPQLLCFISFVLVVGVGCSKKQKDAELEEGLVGVWSFNPREQLAPAEIDEVAFVTPDQIILELQPAKLETNGGRRGDYSRYRRTPKSKHAPERWQVTHHKWFVLDGTLTLQREVDEELAATASKDRLTLAGFAKLPCKDGCKLQRIAEVPAALKAACSQPGSERPGREVSCAH